MFAPKGMLRLGHSESNLQAFRKRVIINKSFGSESMMVTPKEISEICPEIDLTGGGIWPVVGGFYHPSAATARHDRVNWALAEGANKRGVHIHQRTAVTDLILEGDTIKGVQTTQGPMYAPIVMSAVGGHVTSLANMAGLRLPIRTHPLQAFVTNHYQRSFKPIISDQNLHFYVSQTARGEMLMGAHIDRQPSYSYRSGHHFIQDCAFSAITMLPFLRNMRVLRQWTGVCDMSPDYSPIMGKTPVKGFLITTGWGTWGFKAIPASGEQMAQLIATGKTPDLIAPFSLDRFKHDRLMADRASSGTH